MSGAKANKPRTDAVDEIRLLRPAGSLRQSAPPRGNYLTSSSAIGFDQLFAAARRRIKLVACTCLIVLVIAGIYLVLMPRSYKASTDIFLDSRKTRTIDDIYALATLGSDSGAIDSQVEILKSEQIMLAVIDKLDLADDPEFTQPRTFLGRMRSVVSGWIGLLTGSVSEQSDPRYKALDVVGDNLDVSRTGTSFILELTYTSESPGKAALIANTFADIYLNTRVAVQEREVKRISAWLKSRIADLREQIVAANSKIRKLRDGTTPNKSVTETATLLRVMELEADTYRSLHQTLLGKYQQSIEQDTLPSDDVRVITIARPPLDPSSPKKPLICALALFLGSILGTCLAAYLEIRDHSIRTAADVRERLGQDLLAMVPMLPMPRGYPAKIDLQQSNVLQSLLTDVHALPFAEAMRAVKLRLDAALPHRPQVIGIVSALPGEGKSLVASCLAWVIADEGSRPLLVDATVRHSVVRETALSSDTPSMSDAEVAVGFPFLRPDGGGAHKPLSSLRLASWLDSVVRSNDNDATHIVVDLPSLGLFADAPALVPLVDVFVMVVEWGRTPSAVVRSTLEDNPSVAVKCLGVVVNKVNFGKMPQYDNYESSYSFFGRYTPYFRPSAPTGAAEAD